MAITKLGTGPFHVVGFVTPDGFFEGYGDMSVAMRDRLHSEKWRCDCCGSALNWPCILEAPEQGDDVFGVPSVSTTSWVGPSSKATLPVRITSSMMFSSTNHRARSSADAGGFTTS